MRPEEQKEFRTKLLQWYRRHRRPLPWRETTDPYAIWVSEVMLQQTRVETVIPYYQRFLNAFPTLKDLAHAKTDHVLKLWEGLGYYARARNFQKAARRVVREFGGTVPDDPVRFRKLPGVGPYICAAVQSIAFGKPLAVVDGNVKRVLARLLAMDAPVNAAGSHARYQVPADCLLNPGAPASHNQAMMELGAKVCTPASPACRRCPVSPWCAALDLGRVEQLPVRLHKKSVSLRRIAVGVVHKKGRLLITRRKEEGLLGGLWEFPGGGVEAGESSRRAVVREIREEVNLQVNVVKKLTSVKHAYTHFKIEMDVFICRVSGGRVRLNGPVDFAWVTPKQLSDYAFPGANNKFIPDVMKYCSKSVE